MYEDDEENKEKELGETVSEINEDVSEDVFEARDLVALFLNDYFSDEYEILKFNINFLESNGFEYQEQIDYMKLNRFISASYNTIQANDFQVIDVLLSKFYKDIVYLNNFYKRFIEKSKDPIVIYKSSFLKTYGGLKTIAKKLLDQEDSKLAKAEPSQEELAQLDEFLKGQFDLEFDKDFRYFKDNLRLIINTKTYYFDKLLWTEARKSQSIQEFFKKAKREEVNLKEPLSTKIFILQYMKTVDMSHTKNQSWHEYLNKVLKIMD